MEGHIQVEEFCDIRELDKLLESWSKASRMSAVVRDENGRPITRMHGISEFCSLINSSQEGCAKCAAFSAPRGDIIQCHGGLCDFAEPITIPDGSTLAQIACGQVRLPGFEAPDFDVLASNFDLDADELAAAYAKLPEKDVDEVEAARELLSDSVRNFITRSYNLWLSGTETATDRTLSQLTQMLYGYNITLDLTTGDYDLIEGTGLPRTVETYRKGNSYSEVMNERLSLVHPSYTDNVADLLTLDGLRKVASKTGFIGTLEFPMLYPGDDSYEWHEANVFIERGPNGPIANLLGRNVTEAHELQERSNRELRAAATKNQILSDLTKMLYSYNVTLNLTTGKYSLIEGTGMVQVIDVFRSTDDYPTAYAKKIQYVTPDYVEQFAAIASLDSLRGHKNNNGFIGSLEYGAHSDRGEEWHEINVFISSDEMGDPVANLLGRDITESHKRQEQREIAQRASIARDQLLSGVTKMLYSFNVTVNLNDWTYSLITGTGCEYGLSFMQMSDDYVLTFNKVRRILDVDSVNAVDELFSAAALKKHSGESGYVGSINSAAHTPNGTTWQEINLFMGTNEFGEPIANILGRDITASHNRQADREREMRAAAAKDQILSEITQTLYSFNLTVDLMTGKYTLITGTGMDATVAFFSNTDDYATAFSHEADTVLPEYAEAFSAYALEGLQAKSESTSGHIGQIEYGVETPRGTEWHELNVFIGEGNAGQPVANVLGRDVTEAHEAVEQRERELRAVAAKDAILSAITKQLYSYNLTLNLLSGKYSLIVGTGMEEFIEIFASTDDYAEAYDRKLVHVTDGYKAQFDDFSSLRALRAHIGKEGYIGNLEYSANSNDGVEWHEINVFLGKDENGDPVANILGRDVTEAHEAVEQRERELRTAAARDELLSGVTKMLYSYNITVDIATGRYTIITGTGLDATVEAMMSTDDYSTTLNRFMANVDPSYLEEGLKLLSLETYRGGQVQAGYVGTEEFPMKENGVTEWHEINVFSGFGAYGEPIINVLGRDVTEAHEKADTKAQLEIATKASEAKTSFLFNMSHDIRTPMNAIMGFTELLDRHQDDPTRRADYLHKIRESSEVLLSIINHVLEMARIEKGTTIINEIAVCADQFNDTLYSVFHDMMESKDITFTRTINVTHNYVFCDPIKLREIFINILSNAFKYTESGGSVRMDLAEIPSDNPDYAMYQTKVSDTGIGMSADYLPHLFEEFSREHTTTENKVEGTGLGMPIVKRLIEMMDGTIEVQSEVGVGSTFIVTIPHRIATFTDLEDSESANVKEIDFAGKRILLAEDNDLNAEIAYEILSEVGFEVERAEDGAVCVDMLKSAEAGYYDIVLMDIQMPIMDGYEATRAIRTLPDPNRAGILIYAMTANAFEEDRRNAKEAGMDGHLAKPIDVNQLLSALANVLN